MKMHEAFASGRPVRLKDRTFSYTIWGMGTTTYTTPGAWFNPEHLLSLSCLTKEDVCSSKWEVEPRPISISADKALAALIADGYGSITANAILYVLDKAQDGTPGGKP